MHRSGPRRPQPRERTGVFAFKGLMNQAATFKRDCSTAAFEATFPLWTAVRTLSVFQSVLVINYGPLRGPDRALRSRHRAAPAGNTVVLLSLLSHRARAGQPSRPHHKGVDGPFGVRGFPTLEADALSLAKQPFCMKRG